MCLFFDSLIALDNTKISRRKFKECRKHDIWWGQEKCMDLGIIDVTFHRDDYRTNLGSPRIGPSDIKVNLDSRTVILLDDVLYTGRTIRSAMDEIFSFGRPSYIKLGVIIDRGHRELPIRPDYIGKNMPTSTNEHIHVHLSEIDKIDQVVLLKYKSNNE